MVSNSECCVFTIRQWHRHAGLLFPSSLDTHCGPLGRILLSNTFYLMYFNARLQLSLKGDLIRNQTLWFRYLQDFHKDLDVDPGDPQRYSKHGR